jgi:hypothetical protein
VPERLAVPPHACERLTVWAPETRLPPPHSTLPLEAHPAVALIVAYYAQQGWRLTRAERAALGARFEFRRPRLRICADTP